MAEKNWCLYLVECRDGTLYTGITNRLLERIQAHNEGKGAKYTRGRRPVTLLYTLLCKNHSEALKLEIQVKKLTKKNKILFFKNHSI